MNQNTYTLPEGLLQAIVNNLSQQPAAAVRALLNAIESDCARQDQERAAVADARKMAEAKAAWEKEAAEKAAEAAKAQTPAPAPAPAAPEAAPA